jgi:hypothetical protein
MNHNGIIDEDLYILIYISMLYIVVVYYSRDSITQI